MTRSDDSKSDIIRKNIRRYKSSEDKIAGIFVDDGWTASSNSCMDCRWDLRVTKDGIPITLEIKDESNYSSSPNLCIEGWQGTDKHPAGIMTSRADVGIHILRDESATYYNPRMKDWIRENNPRRLDTFKGADNNNGGWLVRRDDVRKEPWFDECKTNRIPLSKIIQRILDYRRNHDKSR